MTTSPPETVPAAGRQLSALLLAPLVPYAWPALAALAARSEVPSVLGRWSISFLAFNLFSVGVIAWIVGSWKGGRLLLLQVGYALLVLLTVLVPMNNQLRELSGMEAWMPLVRLTVGVAALLAGFESYRRRGRSQGAFMALGAALVGLSLIDYALLGYLALAPGHRADDTGLREAYDLAAISDRDVVLVGDSFVWGQGVRKEERFGDVLESLYVTHGLRSRVYSLGQRGFGLVQYGRLLDSLPAGVEADQVVVAFYMNDMPPPETLRGRIQDFAAAAGRGFPTLRLFGDKVARLLTADVEAYHAFVVESYRDGRADYPRRWGLLERGLAGLAVAAGEHSRRAPLLLLLPLMVDFADYPLEDAHARVGEAARAAGFEVLDLLSVFREQLGDGRAHRNAPDDNHFDAATHALVARELFGRLGAPALGGAGGLELKAGRPRRAAPEARESATFAVRAAPGRGGPSGVLLHPGRCLTKLSSVIESRPMAHAARAASTCACAAGSGFSNAREGVR